MGAYYNLHRLLAVLLVVYPKMRTRFHLQVAATQSHGLGGYVGARVASQSHWHDLGGWMMMGVAL